MSVNVGAGFLVFYSAPQIHSRQCCFVSQLTLPANCVAWLRKGDANHDGSVTVICNGTGEGQKRVDVGKEHAGEKWTDVLGWHQGEVTIGDDGWADFFSPPQSISIWTKTDARGRDEFKKE